MQVFQPISRSLPGMAITFLHSFETEVKIFPWIADSFSVSICASLSNCAAVQWVYFHLWSLILFHLISGDCWPTYCEIFKKNSRLDIVAFLVAEINHFRKFICLFYAVCLCVNGPSNRLHGRMQSRTGCICLTFLHCVFLNAVSDCLHYMKYNHTCCMVTCGDGFSPECILCALSKHSQKSYIYHTNYSWNVLKGFLICSLGCISGRTSLLSLQMVSKEACYKGPPFKTRFHELDGCQASGKAKNDARRSVAIASLSSLFWYDKEYILEFMFRWKTTQGLVKNVIKSSILFVTKEWRGAVYFLFYVEQTRQAYLNPQKRFSFCQNDAGMLRYEKTSKI